MLVCQHLDQKIWVPSKVRWASRVWFDACAFANQMPKRRPVLSLTNCSFGKFLLSVVVHAKHTSNDFHGKIRRQGCPFDRPVWEVPFEHIAIEFDVTLWAPMYFFLWRYFVFHTTIRIGTKYYGTSTRPETIFLLG